MKKHVLNNQTYELIEDKEKSFDYDVLLTLWTDYFNSFDYIIGDWSYGKLRLKGFCNKKNKRYKKINDIKNKNKYLKEMCSYNCKFFILKKVETKPKK